MKSFPLRSLLISLGIVMLLTSHLWGREEDIPWELISSQPPSFRFSGGIAGAAGTGLGPAAGLLTWALEDQIGETPWGYQVNHRFFHPAAAVWQERVTSRNKIENPFLYSAFQGGVSRELKVTSKIIKRPVVFDTLYQGDQEIQRFYTVEVPRYAGWRLRGGYQHLMGAVITRTLYQGDTEFEYQAQKSYSRLSAQGVYLGAEYFRDYAFQVTDTLSREPREGGLFQSHFLDLGFYPLISLDGGKDDFLKVLLPLGLSYRYRFTAAAGQWGFTLEALAALEPLVEPAAPWVSTDNLWLPHHHGTLALTLAITRLGATQAEVKTSP